MTEDMFFALIDPVFKELGAVPGVGEDYVQPPLDVLRYYRRGVRLSWVPWLGRSLSVTAVIRQPVDLGFSRGEYQKLLTRVATAVDGRFPPWGRDGGLTLGMLAIVLTPEPIGPGDDAILREVVSGRALPRQRAVPLGIIRANLGQEALSFALASGPEGVFSEPVALADVLTGHLRRFVPLMEV